VATLEQLLDAHQLAHAHPSGSSADIIAGPDPAVCTRARARRPVCETSSTICRHSWIERAIGTVHITCLPAFSAAIDIHPWFGKAS
jgi:hypothetical protein